MQDYDLIADIYEEFEMDQFSRLMVPYIRDLCRKLDISYNSVLDLACGNGMALALWSQLGLKVAGVDGNRVMLKKARQNLKAKESIELYQQELTALEIPGKYDLVTCLYDTVNHLLKKQQLRSLFTKAYGLTEDGGAFIFDINTRAGFKYGWADRITIRQSERYYSIWETDYDPRRRRAMMQITLFTKKQKNLYNRRETIIHERGYPLSEMRKMLKQSGFKKIHSFKCFSSERPTGMTRRVTFLCRKH